MRRICTLVLLLVFVFAAAPAFTQDAETGAAPLASSMYNPGDISISATVGFGYLFSLAIYPGVEVTVLDTMIGNALPFSLGIAARGMFSTYNYYGYTGSSFGLGGFVSAHLSFNDIAPDAPVRFLENFDFYTMLGLIFNFPDYFGFGTMGGFNYFFSNNFAIKLEGNYWGYGGGASIGVLFKL
jgi:hypothetical protein